MIMIKIYRIAATNIELQKMTV